MSRVVVCFTVALVMSCVLSIQSCFASRTRTVEVPDSTIVVKFDDGKLNLNDDEILAWVKKCSDGIIQYFGKFPVKRMVLKITPTKGKGVGYSTATSEGNDGLVEMPLGKLTTKEDLENDWILTHEMVHLNFPLMTGNKAWIAEGMAVYVEPFARVQAGSLAKEKAWGELMRDLPQGLPGKRDKKGLDYSGTWESKYWGGALFYFLADLEIRNRTGNTKGLQDAFRAITAAGGNICSDWSAEKCFEIGDKATGVPVLQELAQQMGNKPVDVDLPALWKMLGLERSGNRAVFHPHAPLANIRDLISAGPRAVSVASSD